MDKNTKTSSKATPGTDGASMPQSTIPINVSELTTNAHKQNSALLLVRYNLKMTLVVSACLLLIAGLIAGAVQLRRSSSQAVVPKQSAQVAVPPTTPDSKAYALAQKGDYIGAQKLLASEQATTKGSKNQAKVYLSQATLALNAEKYADAKIFASAADKLAPTPNTAALLGYIAAQTGEKPAAQALYQRAIDRLDKNANNYNTSLSDYTTKLQEIQ